MPNLGFGTIWGESNFILYYNLARLWEEHNLKSRVLFLVPLEFKGKLPEVGNISWIYEKERVYFFTNSGLFSGSMHGILHPAYTTTPVDCVVMNRPVLAGSLGAFLFDRSAGEEVVVIVNHDSVAGLMCKTQDLDLKKYNILKMLSYALLPNVYNVRWEMECVFDMVRKYLPPYYVDMAMKNAKLIPLGFPNRKIDNAIRDVEKNDKFTMIFAGRWNSAKRIDDIVETFEKVLLLEEDVQACLVNPKGTMRDSVKRLKEKFGDRVKLVVDIKQEDYWREVKRSHVFLYFSPVEGYPVTAREVFYIGVPIVLPRREWVKDLLGKYYDEYPYMHNLNTNEAAFMIKAIKENYNEALVWVEKIKRDILEEEKLENTGKKWYFYLQELVKEKRRKIIDTIGEGGMEMILSAYDEIGEGEVFSFTDFVELMKKFARANKDLFGTSKTKLSAYKVYYWLAENTEDLLDSLEPKFRKKGKNDYGGSENTFGVAG